MKSKNKPRLFIASSVESLKTAQAVQQNLDYYAEVTIWSQGTFQLTRSTLTNLLRDIPSYDFAIFIFAPDDVVSIRNKTVQSTRDNVVFELGLFMSALGEDRTFIIMPRDTELHLPTDLMGATPGNYDPNRSDGNLQAALGAACSTISNVIERLGTRLNSAVDVSFFKIPKRYYQILNKESEKAVDVAGWALDDGADIHLWEPHDGNNQIWEIRFQKLNLFSLISKHSNKCLEVKNSSLRNSATIQQNEFRGADNQLWQFILNIDGSYYIMPRHAIDMYLEQDARTIDLEGGKLIQHQAFNHDVYGHNHQKWILKEVFPANS